MENLILFYGKLFNSLFNSMFTSISYFIGLSLKPLKHRIAQLWAVKNKMHPYSIGCNTSINVIHFLAVLKNTWRMNKYSVKDSSVLLFKLSKADSWSNRKERLRKLILTQFNLEPQPESDVIWKKNNTCRSCGSPPTFLNARDSTRSQIDFW